jgi:hypothetical protein
VVAEVGVRNIKAHGALEEKTGNSLMRRDALSPAAGQAVHEKVKTRELPAHMYKRALETSGAVAFWPLNDPDGAVIHSFGAACGPEGIAFGDPCQSNAELKTPSIPATLKAGCLLSVCEPDDNSIHFNGTDQLIAVHSNPYLNLEQEGYAFKTIELWMRPENIDNHSRIVFAMGRGNHSGLSIYVKKVGTKDKLFMYAWNLVELDVNFGQEDPPINAVPLSCDIHPNKVYYVAFVFDQSDFSYTGFIKSPDAVEVTECGKIEGLPRNAKLGKMAAGGHACIGGVEYDTRLDGKTETSAGGFEGKLQWVAMYNQALNKTDLQAHVDAANTR